MNRICFSFTITFLAGLATMLGIIPIFFSDSKKDIIIPASLAFSFGVMVAISILSLIPEAFYLLRDSLTILGSFLMVLIFIIIGILLSNFIDKMVSHKITNNSLYKLGIISVVVLILHNIPEGITTFISTNANVSLGLTLSFAIALHNIPEGISIAIPIYYATKSRKKATLYTAISGFSEIFGAFIAYLFIAHYINNFILGIILALTAGIMIHISMLELLPNSLAYNKKSLVIIWAFLGFLVMLITFFI